MYCDIAVARMSNTTRLTLQSLRGELSIHASDVAGVLPQIDAWYLRSTPMQRVEESEHRLEQATGLKQPVRWGPRFYAGNRTVVFPHWSVVLLSGVSAAALGIRRPYKFSLRTLLIVTKAIAAILGLVVYATR